MKELAKTITKIYKELADQPINGGHTATQSREAIRKKSGCENKFEQRGKYVCEWTPTECNN